MHDSQSNTRLIAKVVRDLLSAQRFEEYADFHDALRRRLNALKIRYGPSEFDAAITVVESNTRLWGRETPRLRRVELPQSLPVIGREDAARIYRELWDRFQAEQRKASA